MPVIESIHSNRVNPIVPLGHVIIERKKSAGLKVVDLNNITKEKCKVYEKRLVNVVIDAAGVCHLCIGPHSPHVAAFKNKENLTVNGKEIGQVKVLSASEYQDLTVDFVASANKAFKKKAPKVKKDVANEQVAEGALNTPVSLNNLSGAKTHAIKVQLLASKVHQCFFACTKKILEIFIEADRRAAEANKEHAQKKAEKKKELQEELNAEDLKRSDVLTDFFKYFNRLKSLKSVA